MIRGTTMGRPTLFVIGAALSTLLLASALVFANNRGAEAGLGQLPSMTMVYEVYGPSISVGGRPVQPFREVHRLEYRTKTDWVDTVIESPSVDLGRYGSGSNVGSYTRLNGSTVTEYDAMDGSTGSSTVADDTIFVPNAAFAFALESSDPLGATAADSGIERSQVVTSARVCFSGECEENVGGTRYRSGGLDLVLLEGASWALPLQLGDGFLVKTIESQAARQ